MKPVEKRFPVVLFIMLHKVVLILSGLYVNPLYDHIKAIEKHFPLMLFTDYVVGLQAGSNF